ncbi:HAD family hydrolase [Mariprofundus erugo]|uniref:HAD family hydrolase n=1 Tax=Mariprofundus erugo TaxID=2528639 RepID=UPI0010FF0E8B|nr:HAD family hydrolase [Mariprofundus erugo]TLS76857.1 HAD family hydrolase [Mariprofundus erugo]
MVLIMFDIDGTLTESYAYDQQAYAGAFLDATGCSGVNTDWHSYEHVTSHGITVQAIRCHLGQDADAAMIQAVEQRMLRRLQALYRHSPELFCEVAGASDFLDYLRGLDGVTLSLATGCWLSEARFKLSASGIDVDGIQMASSEDGCSRTDIMTAAARRAGNAVGIPSFDRVIYFGDGLWDMKAAAALGYEFVGIGERTELLRQAGVSCLHRDYSAPAALISSLALSAVS